MLLTHSCPPLPPQNLLYERQHYEKEIGSCRSWQSAYSDEQVRCHCPLGC